MSRKREVYRRAAAVVSSPECDGWSCHAIQWTAMDMGVPPDTAERWALEWCELLTKLVAESGGLPDRVGSVPLAKHREDNSSEEARCRLRVRLLNAAASGRLDRVRAIVAEGY